MDDQVAFFQIDAASAESGTQAEAAVSLRPAVKRRSTATVRASVAA
jgi:hypothetical protein